MSSSENSLTLSGSKIVKNNKGEDDIFATGSFTWRISGFSKLKNDMHYSETFCIGGFKWRIRINPGTESFSMYLGVVDASTLPSGWKTRAQFSLTLVNQYDSNKSKANPATGTVGVLFTEDASVWGFKSFIPCTDLYDCSNGYLVNETCIVEAKVEVPIKREYQESAFSATKESSIKKEQKWWEPSRVADSLIEPKTPCSKLVPVFQDSPADRCLSMVVKEVPTTPAGEHIDFLGFGRIDKAFVPLLEEVCSWHPSLIQSQLKSSQMFANSAFTALGRVLHFLKTRKVKDMTLDACDRLRLLWEELEVFRFDLAWLEPHIQHAFDMKKFEQRAGRMKRLREDVNALENEIKARKQNVIAMESEVQRLESEAQRRRATLAVAEVDLQVAKSELAKVEDDVNGLDMDCELDYPRPSSSNRVFSLK